jgi:hypothetical protein
MFNKSVDDRLSSWVAFRCQLASESDPLQAVVDYWRPAPFIPYNRAVDPYDPNNWPTPWEIIAENKYDDFTKALMMGWTLKFSLAFRGSDIEIKTMVDHDRARQYNIVLVDNDRAINLCDDRPIEVREIPGSYSLENSVKLEIPR